MKKLGLGILIGLVILGLAGPIAADPKKAKEPIDKITFIHYRDGTVKGVGKAVKGPACYKLMGIKWQALPISYVINPAVDENAIAAATAEWDKHTGANLFGEYTVDPSANFDEYPDGRNEYSYGDYSQSGVIAVTRVWYTRYGKQIVEYDVMFDTDFIWGDATVTSTVMDLQNIATHETGHGVGLADVYQSACSEVTMYGYSDYGETKKRTLEQPDITGLQKLYGN
jgi:hypothetical protein